jgi:dTDP-4-dehydrorhamnose reductase
MSAEPKILVLGASGFVGQQILQDWGDQAIGTHKNTQYKDTVYFDPLTMSIRQIIGVENCSHAVILYGEREPDVCWQQPEFTHRLNVESTKEVILDCVDLGIVPVFASSEMVFSGNKGMYQETDVPDPILLYGKYKVEVEQFLAEISDKYIVFRLSKVMGTKKNDRSIFANWLAELESSQSGTIRCAQDQYFSLIAIADISRLLVSLIRSRAHGIYHFSDGLKHNRLDLMNLLLIQFEKHSTKKIIVQPVSINDFGLPEIRPLDLSMSSPRLTPFNESYFTTPSTCVKLLLG